MGEIQTTIGTFTDRRTRHRSNHALRKAAAATNDTPTHRRARDRSVDRRRRTDRRRAFDTIRYDTIIASWVRRVKSGNERKSFKRNTWTGSSAAARLQRLKNNGRRWMRGDERGTRGIQKVRRGVSECVHARVGGGVDGRGRCAAGAVGRARRGFERATAALGENEARKECDVVSVGIPRWMVD